MVFGVIIAAMKYGGLLVYGLFQGRSCHSAQQPAEQYSLRALLGDDCGSRSVWYADDAGRDVCV